MQRTLVVFPPIDQRRLELVRDAAAFLHSDGVNRTLDAAAAEKISAIFTEVIVAPEFATEALEILRKKKNLRLIKHQQPSLVILCLVYLCM